MEERKKTGRLNKAIFAAALLCCLTLLIGCRAEAASYSVKLRQFSADMPSATAYFDLIDANGHQVESSSEDISLNIAGKTLKPTAIRQFSRKDEGMAVVIAIDISSSVSQKRFAELKNALSIWLKQLSPKDKVAVISFGDEVKICQDYTSEIKTLLYTVQNLKAKDKQTLLNSGITKSLELAGIKDASLPKRRLIVLASDCMDDSSASATNSEVKDAVDETHVPIYAIFVNDSKKSPKENANVIGEYARRSGGNFYELKSKPFIEIFKTMFKEIDHTAVAEFSLDGIVADGQKQRASLIYSKGDMKVSDGIDVRLVNDTSQQVPETASGDAVSADASEGKTGGITANKPILFGVIAIVIIAGAAVIFVVLKSKKEKALEKARQTKNAAHQNEPATTSPTQADSGTTQKIVVGEPAKGQTVRVPSPAPKVPTLEVELSVTGSRGSTEIYNVSVANRLTLGRKGANASDFGIPGDATISARHCELIFANGTLSVVDLNSTNGTFVNGSPIKGTYPLNNDDRLMLGKTEFKVKITGIR